MNKYIYKPENVCSKEISFDIDDGKIYNIQFRGGCNGNLKAISMLCDGKPAEEIMLQLNSITCGNKNTSCADQLSMAIAEALENEY